MRFSSSRLRNTPRSRRNGNTARLGIELLEDRRPLAVFTVSNLLDGPVAAAGDLPGSLRQAIFDAGASEGADTIQFSASGRIQLTAGQLAVDDHLTVNGPGADELVIDAAFGPDGDPATGDGTRIFYIDDGDEASLLDVELRGLTLSGGDASGPGGALLSRERLTLADVHMAGNSTSGSSSHGGAVYSSGASLTLNRTTLSGNQTTGAEAHGGALYSRYGQVNVTDSTISENRVLGEKSSGGGLASYRGDMNVARSTIQGNAATLGGDDGADGGGIYIREADLVVTGSTITGNSAPGDAPNVHFGPRAQRGGGIHSYYGNVSVTDSVISNNSASQGGGIFNFHGDLLITGSTISGNSAEGEQSLGGGIYDGQDGALEITDSTISGNSVSGFFSGGGGIWNFDGPATITRSIVSGNSTAGDESPGGGIASFAYGLSVISSTIRDNSTAGYYSWGGGIFFQGFADGDQLAVTGSTITGNSTSGDKASGGGIYVWDTSLMLTGSTVSDNSTTGAYASGGGIGAGMALTATISNSTISGNATNARGGGVYNKQGLVVIEHSTITGNSAPTGEGSGVASYGDDMTRTEVVSSIVAGNGAGDVDFVGGEVNPLVSLGYNLIGAGSGVERFDQLGDQTGVANPGLGPLADNSGPTFTHALLAGSSAIDAGNPTAEAQADGVPLFDQRGAGFDRVSHGRIDIGAFELQIELPGSADFNADGYVDGFDFLDWQRGFGKENAIKEDGDADNNQVVDGDDLAVWQNQFGQPASLSHENASDENVTRSDSLLSTSDWTKNPSSADYRAEASDLALAGFTWDLFCLLEAMSDDDEDEVNPYELYTIG